MKDSGQPCTVERSGNQLLSIKQVSREYGVGRTTLYELLATGKLRGVVLGKRGTRIRREDMDSCIHELRPYQPLGKR